MDKSYRLILYSKTIYKEVEIPADCMQISIGTFYDNEIRLNKELFFENISFVISNNDNVWEMECSSNIYVDCGDIRKMLRVTLNHGDEYELRYQNTDADFLKVSFMIDFDSQNKKYADIIPLSGHRNITIGASQDCNIILDNAYIQNDYIVLCFDGDKIIVDVKATTYGVCVNGLLVEENAVLKNCDFLSIANYYFYYNNGRLYTDIDDSITLNGLKSHQRQMKSCFEYPMFHRNTRLQSLIPNTPIPVLDPPEKPEKPKNDLLLSVMPAVAMLILTIVVRGFMSDTGSNTFVIFSACSIGLGIITSIVTFFQGKREYKKSIKERENTYRTYIEQKCEDIRSCREKEHEVLNHIYPDLENIVKRAETFSGDLFDRSPQDEDFLCVRLGIGKTEAVRKIDYKLQERFVSNDELAYIPEELMRTYYYLEDSPIVLPLREAGAIGFVGNRTSLNSIAKNMILDLAIRQYADDVRFFYIMNDSQIDEFKWIRFLPHVRAEGSYIRNIACDTDSRAGLLENLYKEFSRRVESQSNNSVRKRFQHLLIFVLDGKMVMTHPLSKFIQTASSIGVSFLFYEENKELLPMGCSALVYVSETRGEIVNASDDNIRTAFTYSPMTNECAERTAMRLSPICCEEVNLEEGLAKSISLFELLDIFCVEDLDLAKRWQEAEIHKSMEAPLGVKAKGEVIGLDIHEKAHGPHGLVAGTTGSGKSEILQSYILSMATLYHPYEAGFVIIDFKGGGMANQLSELPHLISKQ